MKNGELVPPQWSIQKVNRADIKPFKGNPRTISTEDFEACAASTEYHAFKYHAKQSGGIGAEKFLVNVEYEPNAVLISAHQTPKVQKYHTVEEFRDLWRLAFRKVRASYAGQYCYAECRDPIPQSIADLEMAIGHEFDLPYPDGKRMGLAAEAREFFQKLLAKRAKRLDKKVSK